MAKFRVTLKDPDGVYESVSQHAVMMAKEALKSRCVAEFMEGDWARNVANTLNDRIARWVQYGEYVTIEFDTDAGTATVVEVDK